MFPKYEMKQETTLETIQKIIKTIKPDKLSLIIRHSERYFHEDSAKEPFMELTENGKNQAVKLGLSLAEKPSPKFFTSPIGRCIETAYLIDKGHFQKYGKVNNNATICPDLAPFYIQDIKQAISMVQDKGTDVFLRSWFDNKISEDIMLNPETASKKIVLFMKKELAQIKKNEMGIFVSHDWNIFPVKEFFLGLRHETNGAVGYLESVFLFEKDNNFYLANHQKDAVKI